jgi:hypothetical protein
VAPLDALKVATHSFAAPAFISGCLGNLVPVFRGTTDGNHGVVNRTSSHALRSRVEDPGLIPLRRILGAVELPVPALRWVAVKMLDEETKGVTRILGRGGMKQRNFRRLDDGIHRAIRILRAHFKDQYGVPSLHQTGRERRPRGSSPDDDEVDWCSVFVPPIVRDVRHRCTRPDEGRQAVGQPRGRQTDAIRKS